MIQAAEPRVRVLLADDNRMLSRLLTIFLRNNGYEVDAARNGQEALDRLAGRNFDVLVTDLDMPGVGGADLIDLIQCGISAYGARCPSPSTCRSCSLPWTKRSLHQGKERRRWRLRSEC